MLSLKNCTRTIIINAMAKRVCANRVIVKKFMSSNFMFLLTDLRIPIALPFHLASPNSIRIFSFSCLIKRFINTRIPRDYSTSKSSSNRSCYVTDSSDDSKMSRLQWLWNKTFGTGKSGWRRSRSEGYLEFFFLFFFFLNSTFSSTERVSEKYGFQFRCLKNLSTIHIDYASYPQIAQTVYNCDYDAVNFIGAICAKSNSQDALGTTTV